MAAIENIFIPPERLERNPLMTEEGFKLFDRIQQHPFAPKWTYVVGDRVEAEDLIEVAAFREAHRYGRAWTAGSPPMDILAWVQAKRECTPLFQERLPEGFDLERDWAHIEPMSREDLVINLSEIVPLGADLSRLIVYDTSGATGHALTVPHHPIAMAKYHPLIEFVLARYGIRPPFGPEMVACFSVTARARTVTFPNVFAVWNQAGFAKVNLKATEWGDIERARRFFQDLQPYFLTGDPVGFSEMIHWDIPIKPAAMLSTAVALSPELKITLEKHFRCPVIDWYSSTETGPIAYACPQGLGWHILPHDIYVEVLDEEGFPAPAGQRGEITITGGRNPFLPLLRYRTGDWGRLDLSSCPCGDPAPRLTDLQGRGIVLFRAADGSIVNQVDVGLVLREFIFVQHQFIQRADGSLDVTLRPAPGVPVDERSLRRRLQGLFGSGQEVAIHLNETLGQNGSGKVIPYLAEE